ncbi:MAG: hypothetical protein C4330_01200 [Chitinophagaceae bacterium]
MRSGRNIVLRLFASKRIRYSVAVITFLFLLFMIVVIRNFILLSPDKLYREAYIPFAVSTMNGNYQRTSDSLEINYEQGAYTKIIQLTKQRRPFVDKEHFLIGLSYLQLHDYSKAIVHLREVCNHSNRFSNDGQFYLSLSYLMNQDYDDAIQLMQNIYDSKTSSYQNRFSENYIHKVKLLKWK